MRLTIKASMLIIFISLFLSGCSIKQNIEPAELTNDAQLCIIENKAVREGFLVELVKVLDEKGIRYIVVDRGYSKGNCEWTVNYTANWTWDLALYMSYASITVYRNGTLDGSAVYDSRSGGANLSKFIDAESKIRELVEQLMKEE